MILVLHYHSVVGLRLCRTLLMVLTSLLWRRAKITCHSFLLKNRNRSTQMGYGGTRKMTENYSLKWHMFS